MTELKTIRHSLLIAVFCIGLFQPILVVAQKNYIEYHKAIIKAEELFLDNEFGKSLNEYRKIFTKYQKPFAKDCFAALQIACLRNDTVSANYFFRFSFRQGVSWAGVTTIKVVYDLLKLNPYYEQRIQKLYKVVRAEYWSSIDTGLRKYISLLIRKDFSNKGKEIYVEVLDKNIIALDSVVSIYGYPGERLIGVWDDETINRKTDCHYLSSIPSIMYWHHQCGYPLTKEALIKALKDGELNPREYALTYEWAFNVAKRTKFIENNRERFGALLKTHNVHDYQVECDLTNMEYYYNIYKDPVYHNPDTALVNRNREKIGMASLQHDKRKKEFEEKYALKLFVGFLSNL